MCKVRVGLGSERGSVLVMILVSLMAMLALSALAIDLAYLRDTKAEAQRSADAIALAGASAFRDLPFNNPDALVQAKDRALGIARLNRVNNDYLNIEAPAVTTTVYGWGPLGVTVVQTQDVTLNIIPDSQKVRAWVSRQGVRTFFAKTLARPFSHVKAMATAWATNSGESVNCLKPFVLPDRWYEGDKVNQDVNGNNYMEPLATSPGRTNGTGESWKYQPAEIGGPDYYAPFDPTITSPPQPQTGYGSGIYTNPDGTPVYAGDVGLPMFLTPQTGGGNDPNGGERMGNVFWLLDGDPDLNTYDEIMTGCINASIGSTPIYKGGSTTGQVQHGVRDLVRLDPGATWDQSTKTVTGSKYQDWTKSPRVITIGLVDPKYWIADKKNAAPDPGSQFTNFAQMFLMDSPNGGVPDNIQAIFIGMAPGGDPGPTAHTLVKVLQLIQ